MKLNFWQWLGLILVIVGIYLYVSERKAPTTPPQVPATTNP